MALISEAQYQVWDTLPFVVCQGCAERTNQSNKQQTLLVANKNLIKILSLKTPQQSGNREIKLELTGKLANTPCLLGIIVPKVPRRPVCVCDQQSYPAMKPVNCNNDQCCKIHPRNSGTGTNVMER